MPHLKYSNTYWKVASDEIWITGSVALCCRIIWLAFLTTLLILCIFALNLCTEGEILIAYLSFSLFIFLSSLICEVVIIRTSIHGSISEHEGRDRKMVFYLRMRNGISFIELLLSIFGAFAIAYTKQGRVDVPCSADLDFNAYGPIGQILLGFVIASQFIESIIMLCCTIFQTSQPLDVQPDVIIKRSIEKSVHENGNLSFDSEAQLAYDAFVIKAQQYLKKTLKTIQCLSCNLFGGNQIIEEEYIILGKLLRSLFHHGGFLDLVPTDLIAGFILVASEQKEQRRQKYSSRNHVSRVGEVTKLYRVPDEDVDTSQAENDTYMIGFENSSFVVEPSPHLANMPAPPRIMDLSNDEDRKLLEDGSRYSVLALGCYTHLFALLIQPVTGLCDMCGTNALHTDGVGGCNQLFCCTNTIDVTHSLHHPDANISTEVNKELKSQLSSSPLTEPLNIQAQQRHNAEQDAIERGDDIDMIDDDIVQGNKYLSCRHQAIHQRNNGCCCCWTKNRHIFSSPSTQHNIYYNAKRDRYIKSDNWFKANETGMIHLTKLRTKAKIKYASFQDNVGMKPYIIYHDAENNEVIVAVRGTLSVEDTITDMICHPEEMKEMGVKWGFDGAGKYTHSGMLHAADTLRIEIEKFGILRKLMTTKAPNSNEFPKLVVIGHSLGAGTAVLLAFLLRPQYPSLRCVTFGTPNCMLDIASAKACTDFVVSFANAADVVCRLSFKNTFKLREMIIDCLCRAKANKKDIFISAWDKNVDVYKLMARPGDPLESNEFRDLMKLYNEEMRSRNSSVEHYTHIDLAIPGRIIHLKRPQEAYLEGVPGYVKTDPKVDCYERYLLKKKVVYLPCECTLEHFQDIEVDLDMGVDHFPDNYCNSLEYILEDWYKNNPRKAEPATS